jgi:hypothetical protein
MAIDQPPIETRITPAETQLQQQVVTTSLQPTLLVWDSHGGQHYLMADPMVAAQVEQTFRMHAERWYLDTLILSSYFEKILHPDYQRILTLGIDAVPLILRELEDMPNDWFWALRVLTDADPVRPEQAGDMQAMADAWIEWGKVEGYI